MNSSIAKPQQLERLEFFGTVTASLSHDLNNVLATIGELSGLIEDLLAAGKDAVDPAKIAAANEKVARHVQRGTGYVELLNRFAHSVDRQWGAVDVEQSVFLVVAVAERLARLRGVELRLGETCARFQVEGRPFDLLRLAFGCLELALVAAEQGAEIQIGVGSGTDRRALEITLGRGSAAQPSVEDVRARLARLTALANQLDVRLSCNHEPGQRFDLKAILPEVLGGMAEGREAW